MASKIGVVGAGIIGTTCANVLARLGADVVLIDRTGICRECSWGNAGYLATNLIFPIAAMRDFRRIPRYLIDRQGPLRIRWQHLHKLLPWLLAFARCSTPSRVRSISKALHALNGEAINVFSDLFSSTYDRLIKHRGELRVYETYRAEQSDAYRLPIWNEFGIRYRRLSGAEVREREPNVGSSVYSALYFPDIAHCVDPYRFGCEIGGQFLASGGTFLKDEALDIEVQKTRAKVLLHLNDQSLPVDKVLIATGILASRFAEKLGHHVPLETERGYHLVHKDAGTMIKTPITSVDRGFVMTPMTKGLQLSGTVEFGGIELPADYERASILDKHAKALLPALTSTGVDPWMGHRPSLPDSLPVISASDASANVFFAFGHQHLGLTQAATTALAVSSLMCDKPPPFSLYPYRIGRF